MLHKNLLLNKALLLWLTSSMNSGRTRNFVVGASREQNVFLRGQKSQNLPKMADFDHSFLLMSGASGGHSLWLGANALHATLMPPLSMNGRRMGRYVMVSLCYDFLLTNTIQSRFCQTFDKPLLMQTLARCFCYAKNKRLSDVRYFS